MVMKLQPGWQAMLWGGGRGNHLSDFAAAGEERQHCRRIETIPGRSKAEVLSFDSGWNNESDRISEELALNQ